MTTTIYSLDAVSFYSISIFLNVDEVCTLSLLSKKIKRFVEQDLIWKTLAKYYEESMSPYLKSDIKPFEDRLVFYQNRRMGKTRLINTLTFPQGTTVKQNFVFINRDQFAQIMNLDTGAHFTIHEQFNLIEMGCLNRKNFFYIDAQEDWQNIVVLDLKGMELGKISSPANGNQFYKLLCSDKYLIEITKKEIEQLEFYFFSIWDISNPTAPKNILLRENVNIHSSDELRHFHNDILVFKENDDDQFVFMNLKPIKKNKKPKVLRIGQYMEDLESYDFYFEGNYIFFIEKKFNNDKDHPAVVIKDIRKPFYQDFIEIPLIDFVNDKSERYYFKDNFIFALRGSKVSVWDAFTGKFLYQKKFPTKCTGLHLSKNHLIVWTDTQADLTREAYVYGFERREFDFKRELSRYLLRLRIKINDFILRIFNIMFTPFDFAKNRLKKCVKLLQV